MVAGELRRAGQCQNTLASWKGHGRKSSKQDTRSNWAQVVWKGSEKNWDSLVQVGKLDEIALTREVSCSQRRRHHREPARDHIGSPTKAAFAFLVDLREGVYSEVYVQQ